MYTLLLYLTDVDEGARGEWSLSTTAWVNSHPHPHPHPGAGGETIFKYGNGPDGKMLTVRPRAGRALLWPNTLDSEPLQRDPNGFHAGAPLKSGRKLAVNQWIRQRTWQPGMI